MQTVWTKLRPDKTLGLIWVGTVNFDDFFIKKHIVQFKNLQPTEKVNSTRRRIMAGYSQNSFFKALVGAYNWVCHVRFICNLQGAMAPPHLNLIVNSFYASGDFVFANSLDPDQDQQNVGPDLDPNCLTL